MKKETLTLSNIKEDLMKIAKLELYNHRHWKLWYIIPVALPLLMLGIFLNNLWVYAIIFLIVVCGIIRYSIDYKKYSVKKHAIENLHDREGISISVEKYDRLGVEIIFEPHFNGTRITKYKTVSCIYFSSGGSWRVPDVDKHYKWSREYFISTKGLDNVSLKGDEFFYVSLQGHYEIAYVYPLKFFELDECFNE